MSEPDSPTVWVELTLEEYEQVKRDFIHIIHMIKRMHEFKDIGDDRHE